MEVWSISQVKREAWGLLEQFGRDVMGQMKRNYWQAVIFSFFVLLISVVPSGLLNRLGLHGFEGWVLELGVTLLLVNPLMVANNQYYLWQERGRCFPQAALFSSFQSERYRGIVVGMFVYTMLIFLWSLLLVVPGIVKGYAYRMVPFLLAENPSMSWQRALEISRQTTYGEKMDLFFLDVSFLGWILLCMVTCGLGSVFLMPYYCTTMCAVYLRQQEKALRNGWVLREELGDDVDWM